MFYAWGRFSYAHRKVVPLVIVGIILLLFIGFGTRLGERMSQEGWEDPGAASTSAAARAPKLPPTEMLTSPAMTATATSIHIHPYAINAKAAPMAKATAASTQKGPVTRWAWRQVDSCLRTSGTRSPMTPLPGSFPAVARTPGMRSATVNTIRSIPMIVFMELVSENGPLGLCASNIPYSITITGFSPVDLSIASY